MEQRKRSTAVFLRNKGIHPLLLPPKEAAHQLSDDGATTVDLKNELAPGHDCCAMCASVCEPPLLCPSCESVMYCCLEHLTDDVVNHSAVCSLLGCMRSANGLRGRLMAASDLLPLGRRIEGLSCAEKDMAAAVTRCQEAFNLPSGPDHGWEFIMPKRYMAVYPPEDCHDTGAGPCTEAPPRKRPRGNNIDGGKGPELEDDVGEAPHTTACDEMELELAVELSEHTAVLSYAFTAAFAIKNVLANIVEGGGGQSPLKLVVLGAAADAECKDLASWQVVAATTGLDVHILFLGPDVPDQLAGTQTQLGRVNMCFHKCKYEEMDEDDAAGPPDVYLAFNPGFTCPEYDWSATLRAISRVSCPDSSSLSSTQSTPRLAPLVVATNTFMEAAMESEVLEEHGWTASTQIIPNPYTSLQVAQSGTLANDLYRKNAWLGLHKRTAVVEGAALVRRRRLRGRTITTALARAARVLLGAAFAPLARLIHWS